MELIIHRGSKEIGGTCIELQNKNDRILIDIGFPLFDSELQPLAKNLLKETDFRKLKKNKVINDVPGLFEKSERPITAILLTHSHLDHYGLMKFIQPDIPVYCSEMTKTIIEITNAFLDLQPAKNKINSIQPYKKIEIGSFAITPYLMDHSAVGAFGYLIECSGKKLFYTGDFRATGRKKILFEKMINKPIKNLDYLMMEGSLFGRENYEIKTEENLENELTNILQNQKDITFISMSSQNIDRFVSLYKSARKTGKTLVIDLYTAYIMRKLNEIGAKLPQADWNNIRIFYYHSHCKQLDKLNEEKFIYHCAKKQIKIPEIIKERKNICLLFRDNSVCRKICDKLQDVLNSVFVHSMWEGNLTDDFKEYLKTKKFKFQHLHISGHAAIDDLKRFANALKPKYLIPVHTNHPDNFSELYHSIKKINDREICQL